MTTPKQHGETAYLQISLNFREMRALVTAASYGVATAMVTSTNVSTRQYTALEEATVDAMEMLGADQWNAFVDRIRQLAHEAFADEPYTITVK